jgi:hypothetical protein
MTNEAYDLLASILGDAVASGRIEDYSGDPATGLLRAQTHGGVVHEYAAATEVERLRAIEERVREAAEGDIYAEYGVGDLRVFLDGSA